MSTHSIDSNGEEVDWTLKVMHSSTHIYVPIKFIGDGSFSTIWMCLGINKESHQECKLVAIKIFPPAHKNDANNELDIYNKLTKLTIRNISSLFDQFSVVNDENNQSYFCFVMELMIGSLYDIMKRGCTDTSLFPFRHGFPLHFVQKVAITVIETLCDLHANNMVHCDIKPENILLRGTSLTNQTFLDDIKAILSIPDQQTEDMFSRISDKIKQVYLTNDANVDCVSVASHATSRDNLSVNGLDMADLVSNISSEMSEDNTTDLSNIIYVREEDIKAGSVILADFGSCIQLNSNPNMHIHQTEYYRSPQILLKGNYEPSVDMWALGCTLYELITSKLLFDPRYKCHDKKRSIMQQIIAITGNVPTDAASYPHYPAYFTKQGTLKVKEFDIATDVWIQLLEHIKAPTINKVLFVDFLIELLNTDKNQRQTSQTCAKLLRHFNEIVF